MIQETIIRRVRDIDNLLQQIAEEQNPDLKLIWEYQINLNMEVIDALMRQNFILAQAYIDEIIRSTKEAITYGGLQQTKK